MCTAQTGVLTAGAVRSAAVRGESIPIRLFLSSFNLSPTYKVPTPTHSCLRSHFLVSRARQEGVEWGLCALVRPVTPARAADFLQNVNNKFSVKYYLNLVLIDEEDRRYFKQQEIQLWRRELL